MQIIFSIVIIYILYPIGIYSQTFSNFEARDTDGKLYDLYTILDAGRYVILDLYDHDCPACQSNVPVINSLYSDNGCNDYEVVVIGINWSGNSGDVANFESSYGAVYPSISGTGGGNSICDSQFPGGVYTFPTIILIAPDHTVVSDDLHGQSASQIQALIPGAIGHNCDGGASAPIANFLGDILTINEGESVTFTDESFGCDPTNWSWTFEGGTPSSSTSQNPVITYNTTGLYDVTLEAGNTWGTGTKTKTQYIKVLSSDIAYFQDFESYDNFTLDLSPWITYDIDNDNTYGQVNYNFDNENSKMAFIVFNPSATTPPMTAAYYQAYSGSKYGASIKQSDPNDDWLISPRISINGDMILEFYVRSSSYVPSLSRYTVNISTTDSLVSSFIKISSGEYLEAPCISGQLDEWTQMEYDLSQYNGQEIFIGFHCVSNNGPYMFMIDDIAVIPGTINVDKIKEPVKLIIYPNPVDDILHINSFQEIEVFSLMGQLLKKEYNNKIVVKDLSPGIYLIKAGSTVKKFIKR